MPSPKPPRARGDLLRQGLVVMRLLREGERRRAELADALACSPRTVDRILRAIESAGEPVTMRREGREAWYSLARRPVKERT